MSGVQRRKLADGTDVIWAVPLSGMGHVADEQPQPYLHRRGLELTPRFGGEERCLESGFLSLPLPYGYLATKWSLRQRVFNLYRRRVNIYWRNIFSDVTRKDQLFHFIEQLIYREIDNGFIGECPYLSYRRVFKVGSHKIEVNDTIVFKQPTQFRELYLCPWAEYIESDWAPKCIIRPSLSPNYTKSIKSSTGIACWRAFKITSAQYNKGEQINWGYVYTIE